MLKSALPIHSAMVNLIENFVISCIPTKENEIFNDPIDEEFFTVSSIKKISVFKI